MTVLRKDVTEHLAMEVNVPSGLIQASFFPADSNSSVSGGIIPAVGDPMLL